MRLHHLKALTAIATHGSVTAAARALCLSQPAVTRTVRELEELAGLPLIERNARGVSLTREGERLLLRARRIVHEVERAEEEMALLRDELNGERLRIGVSPLAGRTLLPQAFGAFRAALPDVQVEFIEYSLSSLQDGLRSGDLDFGVATLRATDTTLQDDPFIRASPLRRHGTRFVTRVGGRFAGATTFAELVDAEWLHADVTDEFPLYLSELFGRHGLPRPRRLVRTTSSLLVSGLMLNADVVMSLAESVLETTTPGHIVALTLPEAPPSVVLTLLEGKGAIVTPSATRFIECVRDAARSLDPHTLPG